ncbi:hypothetical protein GYB22_11145 [bacterium]|nr:hypothetical protein [bacterium]
MQRYKGLRLFLFLIPAIFHMEISAQVMQWSNPTKLRGAAVFTKVIGENEQGVFLLRYRNKFLTKSIIIERYSHQLTFLESKSIDLKKSRLVKLRLTYRGIMIITSDFDRRSQTNTLMGQYYDFELKPIGKKVPMKTENIREFGDRGSFRIRIDDAQQNIAMMNTEESEEGNVIINWVVFDANFKKLREKSIEMPHSADEFIIRDFMINNSGKVASLGRQSYEYAKRKEKFKYNIFIWDSDSFHDYRIHHDSVDIKEIALTYDRKNDEAVVASLFGSKTYYGIKGVSAFRYAFTTGKSKETRSFFNKELIKELKVSGEHSEDVIPEGFDFIQLVPRSDGGIMLIAEQKAIATESDIIMVNGIPQSTSKNVYNFNDILVLNINNDGVLDWSHVVHKNQTTINDGGYFSSAVVFVNENYIQLIYNDQIRNSGDVMQYTIYSNGKILSRKLLKSELDFVVVIPPEALQVSSNKMIIPTTKNRRFALLKLVYD